MATKTVSEELDLISRKNGGVVLPEAVVEFAKDPETALHSRFDWDDSEAAAKWRLVQARQVIRLELTVVPANGPPVALGISLDRDTTIRRFTSLMDDRKNGGGYRYTEKVLSVPEQREKLLAQAFAEFEVLRRKYQTLKQLAPVFAALDKAQVKRSREAAKARPQPVA